MSQAALSKWQGITQVVVVGLGVTGLSVVKHLQSLPYDLTIKVIDTRAQPPGIDDLDESIEIHTGSWQLDWLLHADLVVTNPGIALSTVEIQQVLGKGIPVVGDIELFAWAVNAAVIAITGSNGKSTVTDLTGVLAKSAGVNVAVGGNIGVPALDLLDESIELYVLELSSFQLETTSSLELDAAAYLNLSEDHMDRYQGMDDYGQAKQRIFMHTKTAVVNRDDRATYPINNHTPIVSFGFDEQDFGVVWLEAQEYLSKQGQPIFAIEDLNLVGRHNVSNSLVALALLDCVGVGCEKVSSALKTYTGLTHRCQLVADNGGIKWINDSKATNVASTLAALSGLQIDGQLHLLVGGVGKGADFSELAPVLSKLNVQLHCFGVDGDDFLSLHPSAKRWDTIEHILEGIYSQLKNGDAVMLSPACASFDQFKNFMARGDEFTRLAHYYSGFLS
ncbi:MULTISPECIES: UDP-N-acetylmuramoyl-L-alanine--D-glutamate ligase [Vibrio]|uniref:UDP-N-acetylmuramoylalanine--D-glutamate ligase n=1 Tax=Vibrio casei TaxID=673372 RepID=A0A368LKU6_9VIBR|nr:MULTISPECIES: UDP-N-acetylmuramoyl-L-alanine--D-glutamate ligase [Vibrio]RCS72492.1 UDP-N-acetylmuramoyl-L-alanine--D-glutamate ligase [Vibrio casei]SJN36395.1 UDP-N-acetylmuramoylalanine--D-glutamate ligase [Vibrio casei]HBV75166.1 UDP-N-acetylmuramoyl-L-alanine--D-glutamate ligase [Vibrio sp.]